MARRQSRNTSVLGRPARYIVVGCPGRGWAVRAVSGADGGVACVLVGSKEKQLIVTLCHLLANTPLSMI